MISMHTSPLEQPGTGDAGGLNVYVLEVARRLAERGVGVDIFTRATSAHDPAGVELAPGLTVRSVPAGPSGPVDKHTLERYVCPFIFGILRTEADKDEGYYDLVHGHYWLSGRAGLAVAHRWGVPLVQSMHTLAKVKNCSLGAGETPEPDFRLHGEDQLVRAADQLVANTPAEADELVRLYGADPCRITTVSPGVDLRRFTPGPRGAALERIGLPPDAAVLLFVGRLQPHKAPDLLVRAAAELAHRRPDLAERLRVVVVGGDSGPRGAAAGLRELGHSLGLGSALRIDAPQDRTRLVDYYRAASLTVVPSRSESFGLVAAESQACGTPVVASNVGGLPVTVRDGVTGMLVSGHSATDYAAVIRRLLDNPGLREELGTAGVRHAAAMGWSATVDGLLAGYRAVRGGVPLADAANF